MSRKSKVEASPHFEEIVDLLLQGESSRKVSAYLKNEYNETISYATINEYRKKNIHLEDKILRATDKKLNEKVDKKVEETVNTSKHIQEATNQVVDATATQLSGLLKVAKNFTEDYEAMKQAVYDENSRVSEKDVAEMSLKANKLSLEFIKKQESNVEVNINNNTNLSKSFSEEKMREILDAKRRRDK